MLRTRGTRLCTDFPSSTHRDLWLSRRPGKAATRKEVKVNMKHGLSRSCAIINDHPVARCVETFVPGDFFRDQEEVSDKVLVGFGHAVNVVNVLSGYDERVDGRLRIHIFKGGREIVFVHDP